MVLEWKLHVHLGLHIGGREQANWNAVCFEVTSSDKLTLFNPSQTVLPTVNQAFRYMGL